MRPNFMQHRAVARTPQLHSVLLLIYVINILRRIMQTKITLERYELRNKHISMWCDINLRDVQLNNKIPLIHSGTIHHYRTVRYRTVIVPFYLFVGPLEPSTVLGRYQQVLQVPKITYQVPTKYQPGAYPVPDQYILRFLIPSFGQTNGNSLRKTVYS